MKLWLANLLNLSYVEKVSLFDMSERVRLCARFTLSDDGTIWEGAVKWPSQGAEIAKDGSIVKKPSYRKVGYGRE